jgi:hypothetical protein
MYVYTYICVRENTQAPRYPEALLTEMCVICMYVCIRQSPQAPRYNAVLLTEMCVYVCIQEMAGTIHRSNVHITATPSHTHTHTHTHTSCKRLCRDLLNSSCTFRSHNQRECTYKYHISHRLTSCKRLCRALLNSSSTLRASSSVMFSGCHC